MRAQIITGLCWICLVFSLEKHCQAQVTFSEIMFDPLGNENYDEFIEIYNPDSVHTIDLRGWSLREGTTIDVILPITGDSLLLKPRQYAIILDPGYLGNSTLYDNLIPATALRLTIDNSTFGNGGLTNTKSKTIALFNAADQMVAAYAYSIGNLPGHSDEKIDLAAPDSSFNWADSRSLHGTPGYTNSVARLSFDLSLEPASFQFNPAHPEAGDTLIISFQIQNLGTRPSAKFSVQGFSDLNQNLIADTNEAVTPALQFTEPLAAGSSIPVTLNWPAVPAGEQRLLIVILAENDQNLANNQLLKEFYIGESAAGIIINEVLYQPITGEAEWIELFNQGLTRLNLKNWTISDSRRSSEINLTRSDYWLETQSYLVVAEDNTLLTRFPEARERLLVPESNFPNFNNDADAVVIRNSQGNIVDSLFYWSKWGGKTGVSLERIAPAGPTNDVHNWGSCQNTAGATPGAPNSYLPLPYDLALLDSITHTPNRPRAGDLVKFWIFVKNRGVEPATISEVDLFVDKNQDSVPDVTELVAQSISGELIAVNQTTRIELSWARVPPGEQPLLLVLQSPQDQRLENNRLIFHLKVGFLPGCVRITEIMFQPREESTEWVELYNTSPAAIDLQNWSLADVRPNAVAPLTSRQRWFAAESFLVIAADSNILQQFPQLAARMLIPTKTFPTLNNSSDAVTLYDLTRQAIDSVFYEASWGNQPGVALERIELNGSSLEPTNWILSDDPRGATPGEINSIWPHEHDLAVMPNSVKFKPARVRVPATITILANIKNAGRTPADSFQISFYWDKNQNARLDSTEGIGTVQHAGNLPAGDVREVKIQWEVHTPGRYRIGVQVRAPADEKLNNNQVLQEILIGAPSQSLIINEFLYNPASNQAEWIELYNPTTALVSLNGWRVYDSNLSSPLVLADTNFTIFPFDFGIIANDSAFFGQYPWVNCPVVIARNLPTLNNDRDAIVLHDLADLTQDSLFYFASWGNRTGVSLERRYWLADPLLPASWQLSRSLYGATPGGVNSCDLKSVDLELLADSIRCEPVAPNFSDSIVVHFTVVNAGKNSVDEFSISCFNQAVGDTSVHLPVTVHHFSNNLTPLQEQRLRLMLPPSPPGHRQLSVQIDAPGDVDLSNNRVALPLSVGFAPDQVGINEIMYSPLAGQVEWIEIYNRSERPVDIGAWQIADGAGENPVTLTPSIRDLPPQNFAVLTGDSAFFQIWPNVQSPVLFTDLSFPSLNNTAETVWLFDQNGNLMDRVAFEASWGGGIGISLERINPNMTSNEATNWNSCVAPQGGTPGAVNSIFVTSRAISTEFSVAPNPFSPDNDGFEDFTIITFDLPLFTARINLKLYDVRGRLIRTLLNAESSVARRSVIWDGRDDDQQLARVGIYIIFLEALNETQGVVMRAKHTVVLAQQLSN